MAIGSPEAPSDHGADAVRSGGDLDEKTPLLSQSRDGPFEEARISKAWLIPKRISDAFIGTVKVIFAAITAPGVYLIGCFYEEDGHFSLLTPVYKMSRRLRRKRKSRLEPVPAASSDLNEKERKKLKRTGDSHARIRRSSARSLSDASASAITSESEDSERPPSRDNEFDSPSRNSRSKSNASLSEENAPSKRSITIRLQPQDAVRQRKTKRASRTSSISQISAEDAAAIKSANSSVTAQTKQLTKFPRAPMPPRPLVPRRQPSYSASGVSVLGPHPKTLVLDLDETLIHSTAHGGRYTTGRMVEVKAPSIGPDGRTIGPPVPVLYYVHKRPHCDEFLKKVSRWYNLIIFTASIQEYADPVIDWLETERKYFAGRYYRNDCIKRGELYIKDIAKVEPDLSKVMIIDNTPFCYVFHEDNAIPIVGWLSDPTDRELLHLIPLLEGLQYVTDVRAILGLKAAQL
ncbi:uncharacterized protein EI97DRAFT_436296 [Westerdykella ornata]|uniref:FCP1 homology domain-containing protein n=1 Tax=Westerdykella ornata TaxID=318751 RepID=A0A6A6J9I2_WESOR|nr:uncharacterized protein EI97DRAFT_436296 [Westerdykella ornata]KAF2273240.1 hypothetical protein EI97DRAFT_436296 [Westerdykella ornata]